MKKLWSKRSETGEEKVVTDHYGEEITEKFHRPVLSALQGKYPTLPASASFNVLLLHLYTGATEHFDYSHIKDLESFDLPENIRSLLSPLFKKIDNFHKIQSSMFELKDRGMDIWVPPFYGIATTLYFVLSRFDKSEEEVEKAKQQQNKETMTTLEKLGSQNSLLTKEKIKLEHKVVFSKHKFSKEEDDLYRSKSLAQGDLFKETINLATSLNPRKEISSLLTKFKPAILSRNISWAEMSEWREALTKIQIDQRDGITLCSILHNEKV